jgi:hypothetical protein
MGPGKRSTHRAAGEGAAKVVRNVKMVKVSGDVAADKGFRLEHARNVDVTGLKLDVKNGDAITKTDVQ